MKRHLREMWLRSKSMWRRQPNMAAFAYEGLMLAIVINLINNTNNNLFATRLGGRDYVLSLVIGLPQVVAMLVLIPGAILADSMKNKQRMVTFSIGFVGALYAAIILATMLPGIRLWLFIGLLAASAGAMTLYNLSWQAFFSDVIPIGKRNEALTGRARFGYVVGAAIPLITGLMLSSAGDNDMKIIVHQIFFFVAATFTIAQIMLLRKVSGGEQNSDAARVRLSTLAEAFSALMHSRKFLVFVGVAFVFYVSWHLDWTLFYIAQVEYLGLNEWHLSLTAVFSMLVQLFTLKFWSRVNERRGVSLALTWSALALAMAAVAMIVSLLTPAPFNIFVFIALNTVANLGTAVISMNLLQVLLTVIPEKNKTLSISIYTIFVAFSNAIMPIAGVFMYRTLGGDKRAVITAFVIILALRLISAGIWALYRNFSKKIIKGVA